MLLFPFLIDLTEIHVVEQLFRVRSRWNVVLDDLLDVLLEVETLPRVVVLFDIADRPLLLAAFLPVGFIVDDGRRDSQWNFSREVLQQLFAMLVEQLVVRRIGVEALNERIQGEIGERRNDAQAPFQIVSDDSTDGLQLGIEHGMFDLGFGGVLSRHDRFFAHRRSGLLDDGGRRLGQSDGGYGTLHSFGHLKIHGTGNDKTHCSSRIVIVRVLYTERQEEEEKKRE